MAIKIQLLKEKLDHTGIFDFAALYGFAYGWLRDKTYGVIEEKYSEKISGNAKDIVIEWKATRDLSDYFRIEMGIRFEVSGLSDVEVEIEGKKKKMQRGKIALEIKGNLIKDPGSKWEESKWLQFYREIYDKYIIRARVDAMEGIVMADTTGFKDEIKAFLDLMGKRR